MHHRYIQGLFNLAYDASNDVRKAVCTGLVQLLTLQPDRLESQMADIIEYMLRCTQDGDEGVALESCEFWSAFCDAQLDPAVMRPFLPRLVPVLLKNMVFEEHDEEVRRCLYCLSFLHVVCCVCLSVSAAWWMTMHHARRSTWLQVTEAEMADEQSHPLPADGNGHDLKPFIHRYVQQHKQHSRTTRTAGGVRRTTRKTEKRSLPGTCANARRPGWTCSPRCLAMSCCRSCCQSCRRTCRAPIGGHGRARRWHWGPLQRAVRRGCCPTCRYRVESGTCLMYKQTWCCIVCVWQTIDHRSSVRVLMDCMVAV